MKYADRYLINYFLGTSAVGVYSVASGLSLPICDGLSSAVWLAISPLYMKIYKTKGDADTAKFVSLSINYLLLLFVPIAFGISAISNDLIKILANLREEPKIAIKMENVRINFMHISLSRRVASTPICTPKAELSTITKAAKIITSPFIV